MIYFKKQVALQVNLYATNFFGIYFKIIIKEKLRSRKGINDAFLPAILKTVYLFKLKRLRILLEM